MSGVFRFYDNFFYGLHRGRFNFATDTFKLALLDTGYVPSAAYGTRASLYAYNRGDTVYQVFPACFFVAVTAGTTGLGSPTFDTALGALTVDGAVVWKSVGLAQPSTHAVLADVVANEVVGTGYTAGGATLALTNTLSGRRAVLGSPSVNWAGSSITAKYGVIYKVGTVDSVTDPLVGYQLLSSTGAVVESTSGTLKVSFGSNIIYQLGGV